MALANNAIIVVTTITATTMKITDKAAGSELTAQKKASKRAAKVVKNLIDPVHLKSIIATQTAFRTLVQSWTVPWVGGTFLLPKNRYYEFTNRVQQLQDELEKEVRNFTRRYSTLIKEAHENLGELFDPENYPDVLELQDKFKIEVRFMPVPDVNQFSNLGLESESEDRLKAEALEMENELMKEATETLLKRMHNRVEMLHNRLKDTETKRYRESLIEGLEFLVEIVPDLNVTDDPYLKTVMQSIQDLLSGITIDEIRESPEVRKEAADKCQDIIDKMQGFF